MSRPLRIAVVGSGAAGLAAAWLLDREHRVTLFEKNDELGGHVNTVEIPEGPDAGARVDTGFIVMNDRNYPTLTRLLDEVGVRRQNTDMAFSFYDEATGLQYSSDLWRGLFAQRRNIVSPRFWRLLGDIRRFYRRGLDDLAAGRVGEVSLGDYLAAGGFRRDFIEDHILPMGAAIWSTPPAEMMDFPALSFLHFFRNHGLLELRRRPQWMTLEGGSRSYVQRLREVFRGEVRVASPVESVARTAEGVTVRLRDGAVQVFDRAVLAAHADETLALLSDADDEERRLLGPWTYSRNETVLHCDTAALPPSRDAWASWNFIRERGADARAPASVTYYMNRLQRLATRNAWMVSLNRRRPVEESKRVRTILYTHPTFTRASMATQPELPSLNGRRHTYFCGSYFGYGFHEDAIQSGVAAARQLGIAW